MLASKSNKPGSFYIIYNSSYGHQFKTGKFLLVWPAVFCLASRPGVEIQPGIKFITETKRFM